jgi:hypothetical protein
VMVHSGCNGDCHHPDNSALKFPEIQKNHASISSSLPGPRDSQHSLKHQPHSVEQGNKEKNCIVII